MILDNIDSHSNYASPSSSKYPYASTEIRGLTFPSRQTTSLSFSGDGLYSSSPLSPRLPRFTFIVEGFIRQIGQFENNLDVTSSLVPLFHCRYVPTLEAASLVVDIHNALFFVLFLLKVSLVLLNIFVSSWVPFSNPLSRLTTAFAI